LRVDLQGTSSNRDGLGAIVELSAGGRTQQWLARTGSSYLSQSQTSPVFGLGDAKTVDRLVVRWPSGREQIVDVPRIDSPLPVIEP
jgi:predicted Zn-dependent protease